MKKFFTSSVFVLVFAAYALYQYLGNSSSVSYSAPVAASGQGTTVVSTGDGTAATTPVSTTTVSAPAVKPQGQYADGTYTGSVVDVYYGNVQVLATISGGKLTDVAFLQYPNDRNTSRQISQQSMPILKSEAIQAQSAQVDTVSGATDTSDGFRQSLSNALAQAKN